MTSKQLVSIYHLCGISVETSRQAVQIVDKLFYHHEMYLSNPSKKNADFNKNLSEPPNKRACTPLTLSDYEN